MRPLSAILRGSRNSESQGAFAWSLMPTVLRDSFISSLQISGSNEVVMFVPKSIENGSRSGRVGKVLVTWIV